MPWQKHNKHLFLTTCALGGKTLTGVFCLPCFGYYINGALERGITGGRYERVIFSGQINKLHRMIDYGSIQIRLPH